MQSFDLINQDNLFESGAGGLERQVYVLCIWVIDTGARSDMLEDF